ncbi:hypothetical protein BZA77DRAFT_284086 [Pyronema omphalodes]|nr:hypothetical protein BZA77DRAFT_284086 [Pyronema omphalodes]
MKFLTLLSLTSLSIAQSISSNFTPPSKPPGSVLTHIIQVSDSSGSPKFYPEILRADPGDFLQFQFWPGNHSVRRSSFEGVCRGMNSTADGASGTETGFWSGPQKTTKDDRTMSVFSIRVNDTAPIWFFGASGRDCQDGMVGVVNEPENTTQTLAQYRTAAAKSVPVTDTGNATVTTPTTPGASGTGKVVSMAAARGVNTAVLLGVVLMAAVMLGVGVGV